MIDVAQTGPDVFAASPDPCFNNVGELALGRAFNSEASKIGIPYELPLASGFQSCDGRLRDLRLSHGVPCEAW